MNDATVTATISLIVAGVALVIIPGLVLITMLCAVRWTMKRWPVFMRSVSKMRIQDDLDLRFNDPTKVMIRRLEERADHAANNGFWFGLIAGCLVTALALKGFVSYAPNQIEKQGCIQKERSQGSESRQAPKASPSNRVQRPTPLQV